MTTWSERTGQPGPLARRERWHPFPGRAQREPTSQEIPMDKRFLSSLSWKATAAIAVIVLGAGAAGATTIVPSLISDSDAPVLAPSDTTTTIADGTTDTTIADSTDTTVADGTTDT